MQRRRLASSVIFLTLHAGESLFNEAIDLGARGYADPGLREAATRAGACGYLLKEHLTDLPAVLTRLAMGGPQGSDAASE